MIVVLEYVKMGGKNIITQLLLSDKTLYKLVARNYF